MSVLEPSSADVQVPPGAALRAGREHAGISLEVVSQRTMIPLSRLRALENDDYERVGVATFVTGYVRAYAKFLGLDPAPLLRALEPSLPKSETTSHQPPPSVALALQVQKRPRSFFWPVVTVLAIFLGAVALIGINTVLTPVEEPESAVVPSPASAPESPSETVLALPLELTSEPIQSEVVESGSLAAPLVAEGESLADSDFAPAQAPEVEPATIPAQPASAAAEPTLPADETSLDQLEMSFSGDCWVEVSDATGKALIARLATSGDNLQLFGRAPFQVVLGNAPVATVALNGQAVDAAPAQGRKFKRLTVGE